MSDYTQIENYDCPECEWSLHVEKRVWSQIEDHSLVINYIHTQVSNHDKTHEFKVPDVGRSPYIYVSESIGK